MNLTKSNFIVARTCPTKLYYVKMDYPSSMDENEFMQFLADGGYMVEKMAKLLFPSGRELPRSNDPEKAFEHVKQAVVGGNVTLFEATVVQGNMQARLDILQRQGSVLNLIEVKSSSIDELVEGESPFRNSRSEIASAWRPYLEDVTYQFNLLSKAFPDLKVVPHLCVVDKSKSATENTTFQNFQLRSAARSHTVVDYTGDRAALAKDHLLAVVDVTAEVAELLAEVVVEAKRFAKSLAGDPIKRIAPEIGQHCKNCEFRVDAPPGEPDGFRECWGEMADTQHHVLDLYRIDLVGGKGRDVPAEMAMAGKCSMLDIPRDQLRGAVRARQIIQIDHTAKDTEFIDPLLAGVLDRHSYPLHFIDFEASRPALPYHKSRRPYEVEAFQWSCHTVPEAGSPTTHAEWLNRADVFPNFEFARSLMEHLGRKGTVLMWSSFEKTALKEILAQYDEDKHDDPELRDWLVWVTGKEGPLEDMMEIAKAHYFHPMMKGSLSIKYVLPAVWSADKKLRASPEFSKYGKLDANGALLSPYATLPPVQIAGIEVAVQEGTSAVIAYQEMLFGLGKKDPEARKKYAQLLLEYCKLDTNAMVLIWRHWTES